MCVFAIPFFFLILEHFRWPVSTILRLVVCFFHVVNTLEKRKEKKLTNNKPSEKNFGDKTFIAVMQTKRHQSLKLVEKI